ncbi:acetyl/propionyl/methylcrotonyl-CoA carboxylase subunit alpha [Xanthomonas oryzae pv. oryzicola]|uniref:acetyl/propionyl/methylcrotonyl-CoA carboxylase subunit alpha n=1 Tax=Xanthomonas oryzae TaxID=347 RepID=UPI0011F34701|nr:acetyl/propionyl/methylcrotonyl-CoA carboxylase subunit alpha [Xanthomonas oryzae]MEC5079355.1 acetyl/propionyl/methylcrotonyl-CoA carboxylase subunit alpha [Xanthomonas oryzae pv. oryzicola]MEC5114017.1 acetyl/propionyl/methylcrotonyl-CoA carboxylase subunit alpha [Xanthomonas oryzae pv. oryzicola]QEO95095.1 3-methylcrotonyl-CoA carboxylase [Xanthomonas oryzae pv. oryzicola]UBB93220.1 acetyl/propionyl/methylcrotonyl-CoA carboxylase subunit alpha [Xanthomonas oryzae pv. oryzicola]WGY41183.1
MTQRDPIAAATQAPFDKILIANRGEIACRVIATCRTLGIATVAVYSDADRNARHVRLADEAVHIGASPAQQSYLRGEAVLEAARATGAQAIHPGYGFLSENATFAEACAHAGIVFIGPPAAAIRAMGDKSAAKALMQRAGVPLTPGYHGDEQAPAFLRAQADAIGYPVLIKASAGGGGKGMRRVDASAAFEDALASCQREAQSAFGNAHVLVEKYVERPRHIEIQVFGDTHGEVVHLFERDCSVQRRHQKVLEEAPAPGMSEARRAAMGKAAVDAAQAVGYVGAGTVEFIAGPDGDFYFMEMNTRLQVEHPVTELITGTDLVEWQLRVAAGARLPRRQHELRIHGHALEARLYAEDAERGFLPSTGTLRQLQLPVASAHVRIDAGVEQGDTISPYYDPMIAKLIVWETDRPAALARMRAALAQFHAVGVTTNSAFLSRLIATAAFASANLDTALIEREHAVLFPQARSPNTSWWCLAAVLIAETLPAAVADPADPHSPWQQNDGWRIGARAVQRVILEANGERRQLDVRPDADGWQVTNADQTHTLRYHRHDTGLRVEMDGRQWRVQVLRDGSLLTLIDAAQRATFHYHDALMEADQPAQDAGGLTAPMPGRIVSLAATVGQPVTRGQALVVLEAMKMEHTLHAPSDGTVQAYLVAEGDLVADGAALVEFVSASA